MRCPIPRRSRSAGVLLRPHGSPRSKRSCRGHWITRNYREVVLNSAPVTRTAVLSGHGAVQLWRFLWGVEGMITSADKSRS